MDVFFYVCGHNVEEITFEWEFFVQIQYKSEQNTKAQELKVFKAQNLKQKQKRYLTRGTFFANTAAQTIGLIIKVKEHPNNIIAEV